MIFDTSVWIQFLKGQPTKKADLLDEAIKESKPVYLCPPIFQEILQGIRKDQQYETVKDLLLALDFFQLDPYEVAENAAQLYRLLRKNGVTINKPNDCLIASYAIYFKLPLVHEDSDFDHIAEHSLLKVS